MIRIALLISLLFATACEGMVGFDDPGLVFGFGADATNGSGIVASGVSGAELFQANCASCHGAQGEGTPIWPASIQGYAPIEPILLNGRGTMAKMALPSEDMQKIQGFLTSLAVPSETLDGPGLYQRYCSSCHGADASGAASWPNSIQGYTPIASIVQNGRGTMAAIPITPAQTQLIQDWIVSLATPASELDGQGLYSRYCASCHGADAKGGTEWANSIESYEPIQNIVLQGRGDMAAIPITADQTQQIQDWLLTLGTPTADLDGQGLFGRYCASCHGADAAGDVEWSGSIQGYEPIAGIVQQGRGSMDAVDITPAQIQDIQDWLLTLAPSLSSLNGQEVYERLCVTCHGAQGEGLDTKGMQLRYDDDAFSRYWIRNGRTATSAFTDDMPAYGSEVISDTQIDEMLTFINQAQKPTSGQGLFVQYCANCHGANGAGGPSGHGVRGDDSITGISRNGRGGTSYGSRRNYMTSWNTNQISDSELQMIGSYVIGL